MRSLSFVIVASVGLVACGAEEAPPNPDAAIQPAPPDAAPPALAVAEPGALPPGVDFPRVETLPATAGQLALGIDPYRLEDARKGSLMMLSYTNYTVVEPGPFESKLERISAATLPNALVIPLAKGEQVAKGDEVLTWWQTGGGMQHGLVTGGTPTEPTVRYITLGDTVPDASKEWALKPDSFTKLDEPFEVGSNVAYKSGAEYKWATIVGANGDKLLVLEAGSDMKVVSKAASTAIPVKPTFKAGDAVYAPFVATLGPAKVVKVDDALGKITVKLEFASQSEAVVPFGQVTQVVPP